MKGFVLCLRYLKLKGRKKERLNNWNVLNIIIAFVIIIITIVIIIIVVVIIYLCFKM